MDVFLQGYASRPRPHLSGLSATVPSSMHATGCVWPQVYADIAFGQAEAIEKLWVRVSGVWKQASAFIRIAGVWKAATPFIRVSGVWK